MILNIGFNMDHRGELVRYFMESYIKGLNTLMGGNASYWVGWAVSLLVFGG